MAYCRMSEECSVYLYHSCDKDGEMWVFHLPYNRPYLDETTLIVRNVGEALRLATVLQKNDYGVPDSALDRLQSEM